VEKRTLLHDTHGLICSATPNGVRISISVSVDDSLLVPRVEKRTLLHDAHGLICSATPNGVRISISVSVDDSLIVPSVEKRTLQHDTPNGEPSVEKRTLLFGPIYSETSAFLLFINSQVCSLER
jgi:hypothetical protein